MTSTEQATLGYLSDYQTEISLWIMFNIRHSVLDLSVSDYFQPCLIIHFHCHQKPHTKRTTKLVKFDP